MSVEEDTWKRHARAAMAALMAAFGAIYDATRLERLMEARMNIEKAIEAFSPAKE